MCVCCVMCYVCFYVVIITFNLAIIGHCTTTTAAQCSASQKATNTLRNTTKTTTTTLRIQNQSDACKHMLECIFIACPTKCEFVDMCTLFSAQEHVSHAIMRIVCMLHVTPTFYDDVVDDVWLIFEHTRSVRARTCCLCVSSYFVSSSTSASLTHTAA